METAGFSRLIPMEMLTIKKCTEAVKGLSEHTACKLVTQGQVHFIRTGEGKCGKS